jgi:hypothetical protein
MAAPSTAPTPKAAAGTGTQVVVTQADIDDVASKLDEFGAVLNDREKAILLGVFSLAAGGISKAAQSAGTPQSGTSAQSSVPSLSAGFRTAFQKGVGTRFTVDSGQTEAVGVKVGIDFTK